MTDFLKRETQDNLCSYSIHIRNSAEEHQTSSISCSNKFRKTAERIDNVHLKIGPLFHIGQLTFFLIPCSFYIKPSDIH
jgi:hypothetical protein